MNEIVECPYCYTSYELNKYEDVFECNGCESYIEVKYDENGKAYIDKY